MKTVPTRNVIAGTAGHIDHGKTALVRALTGIDTDRLKEEKERGISIDLGFAHLELARDLRIGFVDVPGHERFIKNMLAGAGGIDVALLVIAADESIKPQTREHLDICRLLHISRGLVVLTKADLVDQDILALVRLEVEEFVRGSFLEGAPIVPVSSKTGEGILDLRAQLETVAREVEGKDAGGYFRMPIDRVFSMRGFGTVVTGTLLSGIVKTEQEVEVLPGGRRVRVRGIQVHGATVPQALAGQRTALNLSGVEVADLARGMVLAEAGRFRASTQIDVSIELLPYAKALKHRAPVHFHAGAAEVEATVSLLGDKQAIQPGGHGWARMKLREPMLLLPGDRFVIRTFSPVITIGGGAVLDSAPPRRRAAESLHILENGNPAERIRALVTESRSGMDLAELVARLGLPELEIRKAADAASLVILQAPHFWAMDPTWVSSKLQALHQTLKTFHREHPLLPGVSKEELRTRELADPPAFVLDGLLARSQTLVAAGETVRLLSHKVALKQDEEQAASKIEKAFQDAGLEVPATSEVLKQSGLDPARARTLLQILMRDKKLVRVGDDLVFHSSAIAHMRELLAQRKGVRFAVPQFKEWTGVSRKYAIPLLEFLDRERVTRREGDLRLVL